MSKIENKKKHILKSANELLIERGISDITIDDVAKKAGYSKGGVTHYYASKDELLISLAEMINNNYLERIEEEYELSPKIKGSWTRALIQASEQDLNETTDLNIALVATTLANKNNLESIIESFDMLQNKVTTDGFDPVLGTIIRLAIDGLYYAEMFNVPSIDEEMKEQVFHRMMEWTKEQTCNEEV